MIPVDVSVKLVQDSPAALRRPRAKNIAGIKLYLRLGKRGCHRFANSLHKHLDCRPANFLDLSLATIGGVLPIKPIATQTRNNLQRIKSNSTMLGEKIKDESLGKRKRELEEVPTVSQ